MLGKRHQDPVALAYAPVKRLRRRRLTQLGLAIHAEQRHFEIVQVENLDLRVAQ